MTMIQAIAFAVIVAFAVLGALEFDRRVATCDGLILVEGSARTHRTAAESRPPRSIAVSTPCCTQPNSRAGASRSRLPIAIGG